jgi:hemolysin-activating ACP:hemolysin acyltransferase
MVAMDIQTTNAVNHAPKTALRPPALGPAEARHERMAYNFSQVIAVLMRDANFKNLMIADLEWLVFPALLSGQFKLAHSRSHPGKNNDDHGGAFIPVALAMWARVSPQVDKALSENLDKPAQLRPDQWSCGDIPWLMVIAGDKRAVPTFLKQLGEKEFKGEDVKLRAQGPNGNVIVKKLAQYG